MDRTMWSYFCLLLLLLEYVKGENAFYFSAAHKMILHFFYSGRINNQTVINYALMHQLIGGKNQSIIINADKTEKIFIRVLVGAEAGQNIYENQ